VQEHSVASKMLEDGQGQIWFSNGKNQLIRIYQQTNQWQVEKIDFGEQTLTPLMLDGKLLISNNQGLFHWDHQNNILQALLQLE
jgi:hypothetical protein